MRKYGLFFVWVAATIGVFGSLAISELMHQQPCLLDWFERICLYPLIIIAGQAAWHGDYRIASYLLPQTLLGLGTSVYHLLLQDTNWLHPIPGCMQKADIGLGFVSTPLLSTAVFLLINALLLWIWRISKKTS